jgi:hypothetical protein
MGKMVVLKKVLPVIVLTNNEAGENGHEIVLNARHRLEQWVAGRCYFRPESAGCSAKEKQPSPPSLYLLFAL